jgi:hypothetical protein
VGSGSTGATVTRRAASAATTAENCRSVPILSNCSGVTTGGIRAEAASAAAPRDEPQFAFSPRSLEDATWKAFRYDGDPRRTASGAAPAATTSRSLAAATSVIPPMSGAAGARWLPSDRFTGLSDFAHFTPQLLGRQNGERRRDPCPSPARIAGTAPGGAHGRNVDRHDALWHRQEGAEVPRFATRRVERHRRWLRNGNPGAERTGSDQEQAPGERSTAE